MTSSTVGHLTWHCTRMCLLVSTPWVASKITRYSLPPSFFSIAPKAATRNLAPYFALASSASAGTSSLPLHHHGTAQEPLADAPSPTCNWSATLVLPRDWGPRRSTWFSAQTPQEYVGDCQFPRGRPAPADTQRHTETHRDRQRHRDTQRHTETDRHTHRDRQRHTETHRNTQRHTQTQ